MLDHPERETVEAATCTRQCPSIEGDARKLITHTIDVSTCMARQRDFYHKCHRCQYRGKAAGFVLDAPEADGPVSGGAASGGAASGGAADGSRGEDAANSHQE